MLSKEEFCLLDERLKEAGEKFKGSDQLFSHNINKVIECVAKDFSSNIFLEQLLTAWKQV